MSTTAHLSGAPGTSRRRSLAIIGGALCAAWSNTLPAAAQFQTQKPMIPGLGTRLSAPVGSLDILNDGTFVDAIDGQREGIWFALGSVHTIRGRGLGNAVQGFLMSARTAGDQAANIGSALLIESNSDSELVVRVSGISAGRSVWKPGVTEAAIYMLLRTDGGAREFNFLIPRATYSCDSGQDNCA